MAGFIANGLGYLPPFLLLLLAVVVPQCVFFAPSATECRYAFQIADHSGAVVLRDRKSVV